MFSMPAGIPGGIRGNGSEPKTVPVALATQTMNGNSGTPATSSMISMPAPSRWEPVILVCRSPGAQRTMTTLSVIDCTR